MEKIFHGENGEVLKEKVVPQKGKKLERLEEKVEGSSKK